MKSLSISTATAAVAISLASSAQANETAPYIAPEMDTLLFAEGQTSPDAAAVPVNALDQSAPITLDVSAPAPVHATTSIIPDIAEPVEIDAVAQQAIYDVDFLRDTPEGLLTLPMPEVDLNARVVTTRGLDPLYGDIDAFYGDIVAFYGDIDAFWGDISPFYGDIDAFWGDISPFYGDIDAFWGDIDAFYGDIDAFWGDIDAFRAHVGSLGAWGQQNTAQVTSVENVWKQLKYEAKDGQYKLDYDGTPEKIVDAINTLVDQAEAQFSITYTAKTGKSFREGFVEEFFSKYGIDLNDQASLAGFSAQDRAKFYLDWHDSLNQYSGVDAVDHWMRTVNWTPSLTQIQSEKGNTVVGVIDAAFGAQDETTNNLIYQSGSETKLNGHGSAVASLLFAPHDGEGVMGIAPNATVTAYNPFAFDGTATWHDVEAGILAIKGATIFNSFLGEKRTASVINLSLGEKGFVAAQGLSNVLSSSAVKLFRDSTVYVVAAGNDGIAQTTDVEWDFNSLTLSPEDSYLLRLYGYPTITSSSSGTAAIFVGSLGLDGQISHFSNTPGEACLLDNGVCRAGNELKNFFIVAPGEMLLVDNGHGGVTRASGTSFSAPLVSGAIALLHDRWPWLANNPHETTEIIFRSAKDLGDPGVDAVYGHGLLDITASQSPLDFGNMTFTLYQKKGNNYRSSSKTAVDLLGGGVPDWWDTSDVFFTGFEDIGDTYRDFAIPMSAFTYGLSTNALGNGYQRLQDFVSDRFANWLLSDGTDKDGDGTLGLGQVRSNQTEIEGQWSLRFDAIAPQFSDQGTMRNVHSAATLTDPSGKASFTLGHGQGALALAGGQFGIVSDHDANTGGVNPVLGLASGEIFAGAGYKIASATTLSIGYSAQREDFEDLSGVSELDRQIQRQLGAREADAITFGLEQKVTDNFTVNAQYTHLREDDALLGAQTGSDALLGEGSRTNAFTVSANMEVGNGLSFDLSVTGGATETSSGQLLATSNKAMSTAGQFAVNKRGVMNGRDVLRLSVGQPMTVESGELELRSEQVVDRLTGERGVVSQFIGIDTKRRVTGEIVYATPITEASEFGLIGRYISEGELGQDESVMIGANFNWRF